MSLAATSSSSFEACGVPAGGALQGSDDGGDEADRVGVGDVAAEPRQWPLGAGGDPVGENRGLTSARRTYHQG